MVEAAGRSYLSCVEAALPCPVPAEGPTLVAPWLQVTIGLAMALGFGALSRFHLVSRRANDGRVARGTTYWLLGGSLLFAVGGVAAGIQGVVRLI